MSEQSKANMGVYKKLADARRMMRSRTLKSQDITSLLDITTLNLVTSCIQHYEIFDELGLIGIGMSFTKEQAELRIVDTEIGGEIVITCPFGSAALKGCHEVQNMGACQTYNRRYLYTLALEILEHDALDSTTGSGNIETIDVSMMIDHLGGY
jgi:hypothetical protein